MLLPRVLEILDPWFVWLLYRGRNPILIIQAPILGGFLLVRLMHLDVGVAGHAAKWLGLTFRAGIVRNS